MQLAQMCDLTRDMDMTATFDSMRLRLHAQLTTAVDGSTVARVYEMFICQWVGTPNKRLRLLYRSTHDGPSYGDLLRCVGSTKGLVFVVRKNQYVFGAYISEGIKLPDAPMLYNRYECGGWQFCLAGNFDTPTKVEVPQAHVYVAGSEGAGEICGNISIEGSQGYTKFSFLCLGYSETDMRFSADMRFCCQGIDVRELPTGYRGHVYEPDLFPCTAGFSGSHTRFLADELEVLCLV
mmetsp:Transcript_23854/g.58972  ORF Transcript_23854/g.58972 Transcript_23854/m.58972 type:complete len:236 (-) Transcript_23854:351-1058(-)